MFKFLAFSFLFSNVCFGQQNAENWITVTDKLYTIQHPSDWEFKESNEYGATFYIFSPLMSDDDKFKENVNLLIQDLSLQNVNLNQFVEISEDQVKTIVNNGKIIESTRINTGENEFHKMIFQAEQGMYKLKFLQYYWVKNKKAYVLTFTTELDQFEDFQEIGELIMNSFVIQ
jgi:serine/threonine-protein kinase